MIGTARWCEIAISLALSAGLAGPSLGQSLQPPVVPQYGTAEHLGVASCASSTCHGGAVAGGRRQRAAQRGRHLAGAGQARPLQRAAEGRALAQDHPQSRARRRTPKICLDCHTDNVPEERRGEKFQLSDGVGCEACHGGSQNWIGVHTVVDDAGGHARNVAAGLFPTADPKDRARLCLSCHFGDESKFVDHRIMGAGHPRLSFELDTFTQIEPAHFDVDDDYRTRKDVADAVQTWAIGQGMALSQTLGCRPRPQAQPRRHLPRAGAVRLPRLPSADERSGLAASPQPGPGAGHRPLQRRQPGHAADRGGRRLPAAGQEADRAGARLPSGEP